MNAYCYIERENQKSKSGSSYSVVFRLPKCSFPVKYKTDISFFFKHYILLYRFYIQQKLIEPNLVDHFRLLLICWWERD